MITSILYILGGYVIWWIISRLGLIAAWMYSKPGTLGIRHYLLITVGMLPLAYELVASILVIFSVAFGIDPRTRKENS